jgi:hypothetical protein
MMHGKTIKPDPFRRMDGNTVNVEWLDNDSSAMTEPIVIESPEGLGMKMPEGFTVSDVAETLGEDTPVEVIGEQRQRICVMTAISLYVIRCCDPIKRSRMDSQEVGRILQYGT